MASHKAPLTRVQAKRRARLQRRIALIPLFCLFAAFMLAVMVNGTMREAYGVNDAAPVARASVDDLESTSVSRSSARSEINHGTWESDDDIDPSRLGAIPAQNPVVYRLVNGRDRDQTPDGFDPDHADGDTGNAYSFSQCTWWAYKRRHELNLPAGSHMGDGAMWADSARKLGYWVDHQRMRRRARRQAVLPHVHENPGRTTRIRALLRGREYGVRVSFAERHNIVVNAIECRAGLHT